MASNDPYTPESRLLAQLLSDQKQQPFYSVGAGAADAAAKIFAGYMQGKQQRKEKGEATEKARQMSKAFGTAMQSGNLNDGPPMSPQMSTRAALSGITDPTISGDPQTVARVMELAKMSAPPQDRYENVPGVGMARIPGAGGMPSPVEGLQVPAPRDPNAPLSPDAEAQKIRIAQAGRALPTPKIPNTKSVFDTTQGKNVLASDEDIASNPGKYEPQKTAKDRPQAFKDAISGISTLRGRLKQFKGDFEGEPERVDEATGEKIPAKEGLGAEMFGGGAGTLDAAHTQILLGVKSAEQLGALDRGAVEVAERMLRRPTGWDAPFQQNSYTSAQIKSFEKYLDEKEGNLKSAYESGQWQPPGLTPPAGTKPDGVSEAQWGAMSEDQKAAFK